MAADSHGPPATMASCVSQPAMSPSVDLAPRNGDESPSITTTTVASSTPLQQVNADNNTASQLKREAVPNNNQRDDHVHTQEHIPLQPRPSSSSSSHGLQQPQQPEQYYLQPHCNQPQQQQPLLQHQPIEARVVLTLPPPMSVPLTYHDNAVPASTHTRSHVAPSLHLPPSSLFFSPSRNYPTYVMCSCAECAAASNGMPPLGAIAPSSCTFCSPSACACPMCASASPSPFPSSSSSSLPPSVLPHPASYCTVPGCTECQYMQCAMTRCCSSIGCCSQPISALPQPVPATVIASEPLHPILVHHSQHRKHSSSIRSARSRQLQPRSSSASYQSCPPISSSSSSFSFSSSSTSSSSSSSSCSSASPTHQRASLKQEEEDTSETEEANTHSNSNRESSSEREPRIHEATAVALRNNNNNTSCQTTQSQRGKRHYNRSSAYLARKHARERVKRISIAGLFAELDMVAAQERERASTSQIAVLERALRVMGEHDVRIADLEQKLHRLSLEEKEKKREERRPKVKKIAPKGDDIECSAMSAPSHGLLSPPPPSSSVTALSPSFSSHCSFPASSLSLSLSPSPSSSSSSLSSLHSRAPFLHLTCMLQFPAYLMVLDLEGIILDINYALSHDLGFSREEMIGRSALARVPAESARKFRELRLSNVVEGRAQVWRWRSSHMRSNGDWSDVVGHSSVMFRNDKAVATLTAGYRDSEWYRPARGLVCAAQEQEEAGEGAVEATECVRGEGEVVADGERRRAKMKGSLPATVEKGQTSVGTEDTEQGEGERERANAAEAEEVASDARARPRRVISYEAYTRHVGLGEGVGVSGESEDNDEKKERQTRSVHIKCDQPAVPTYVCQ